VGEDRKIYYLSKTKERILEDSQYLIERTVNKLKHLLSNETNFDRIVAIKKIMIIECLRLIEYEYNSSDVKYHYIDKILPEINVIVEERIRSLLN